MGVPFHLQHPTRVPKTVEFSILRWQHHQDRLQLFPAANRGTFDFSACHCWAQSGVCRWSCGNPSRAPGTFRKFPLVAYRNHKGEVRSLRRTTDRVAVRTALQHIF